MRAVTTCAVASTILPDVRTMTGVPGVSRVPVLSQTADSHSDQADTTKGESGQINVHPLIYRRLPSPWQDMSTITALARIRMSSSPSVMSIP